MNLKKNIRLFFYGLALLPFGPILTAVDPDEGLGHTMENQEILHASFAGDLKTLRWALKAGGDANIRNDRQWIVGGIELKGTTPLMIALSRKNIPCAVLLLSNGADVNGRDLISGSTPLFWAITAGNYDGISLVLDRGAEINVHSSTSTPLELATSRKQSNVVDLLISRGANVNLQNTNTGWTALMRAVHEDYHGITRLLISKGARQNLTNRDGQAVHDLTDRKKVLKIMNPKE